MKNSAIHDGENILAEFRNGIVRSVIAEEIESETEFLHGKGVRCIRAIARHIDDGVLAGMTPKDKEFAAWYPKQYGYIKDTIRKVKKGKIK